MLTVKNSEEEGEIVIGRKHKGIFLDADNGLLLDLGGIDINFLC